MQSTINQLRARIADAEKLLDKQLGKVKLAEKREQFRAEFETLRERWFHAKAVACAEILEAQPIILDGLLALVSCFSLNFAAPKGRHRHLQRPKSECSLHAQADEPQ